MNSSVKLSTSVTSCEDGRCVKRFISTPEGLSRSGGEPHTDTTDPAVGDGSVPLTHPREESGKMSCLF